jgi:isopropylmalate/homocitrate/citramalate synthase
MTEILARDEPELYRSVFPYSELPRAAITEESVPINLPKNIWVTDTTFRDGQQAREPYTVEQIVNLYEMMHKLSGESGIIRNTEFFLYTDRDRHAIEKCRDLGYDYPQITGWIRANKQDLELVKKVGLDETGILCSLSDYHIFYKLGWSREETIANHLNIAEECLTRGIVPRCHVEDATRADLHGVVLPFAERLMDLSKKYGLPVKIRVCDTLGVGLPFAQSSLPRSIPKIIHALTQVARMPSEWLEFHGHNDFHLAIANSTAAWMYGCSGTNGTLLSIGERAGNSPIEGLVFQLLQFRPKLNVNTRVVKEIADYYAKIGFSVPEFYPIIGNNFPITSSGIHADGIVKNPEIYMSYDITKMLGTPNRVVINHCSGSSGVAWKANELLKIPKEKWVKKDNPEILRLVEEINHEYEKGRVTSFSDTEVLKLLQHYIPYLRLKTNEENFNLYNTGIGD